MHGKCDEINFLQSGSLEKIIEGGWLLHSRFEAGCVVYVFETHLVIPNVPTIWPYEPK